MRQSGHYSEASALDEPTSRAMLSRKISELDVADARSDVERFLSVPSAVDVWSREFFSAVADRVMIRGVGSRGGRRDG